MNQVDFYFILRARVIYWSYIEDILNETKTFFSLLCHYFIK